MNDEEIRASAAFSVCTMYAGSAMKIETVKALAKALEFYIRTGIA